MVNATTSCPPKCEGCYSCGLELATHEDTDDTGNVDHKAGVPATVLENQSDISEVGHRCTVNSNEILEKYDLNNVLTSRNLNFSARLCKLTLCQDAEELCTTNIAS